jgi:hypothetical protein
MPEFVNDLPPQQEDAVETKKESKVLFTLRPK